MYKERIITRLPKALFGLSLLTVSLSSFAEDTKPSFTDYVVELKQEAKAQGIPTPLIESAFDGVTYKPRAVKADRSQPEKKLTLDEYIPKAVPDWKVKQAQSLYRKHYTDLKRIGDEYGVQPRFIVALWGVESNFGTFTGRYKVINALTTMAYEGRREAFFKTELMAALKILDEGHIPLSDFKGSWAGAMGQSQFMPTSFLAYAADGNNDGKKDIWQTKADVFASTAKYLSDVGWDDEFTWGRQVTIPQSLDESLQGRDKEKAKKLQEWAALGVTKLNGQPLPKLADDIDAWLILPDDKAGRAYLVYNNYNVIMRWNRSYYFALAVSHLADRITGR
ncbi:lytic murein transglycosylase [Vibrio sp.]|nr:lytic murein transglycosylase [Vibrio sp.]